MAEQTAVVSFSRGARIYEEGSPSWAFFIIREGGVRISRNVVALGELDDKTLGAGDFFGVESALTSRNYRNNAAAISDVSLIAVPQSQYESFAAANKPIAMKILLEFSTLVRQLNETLSQRQPPSAAKPAAAASPPSSWTQEGALRIYPRGAVIFNEGDEGNELFIIQRGSVKIIKNGTPDDIVLAVLKAGAMFGEMGLLEQMPRSATACAAEPSAIAVIDKENYTQIIAQPKAFVKLSILLADRVWFLCKQLANILIKNPAERFCDIIVAVLEREGRGPTLAKQQLGQDFFQLGEISGMTKQDFETAAAALSFEKLIQVENGRIIVKNVAELYRRNEVFWKLYRG
jgi:CRP-like cAMP-binding protein